MVEDQDSGNSDHNWAEAADGLGRHHLLLEEGTAREEGLRTAHRLGRQDLGCSRSRLLRLCFVPFRMVKRESREGVWV